jgi:putative glutamine amidotransferase
MSEKPRRYVILISGAFSDSKSVAAIMSAMRMGGGIPMLIADHSTRLVGKNTKEALHQQAQVDLDKADAVIVMGNDFDIDPADYGETVRHPQTKPETDEPGGRVRADYEYALIEGALKDKKPLFGVCGGMQRLNVLHGGTLHQHVPDLVGTGYHHQGAMGIAPFIPVQHVAVVPGTKLASIGKDVLGLFTPQHDTLPPGVFMENSFHHQAVDKVGAELIPCAFSIEPDRPDMHIVQAIEADPKGKYKNQFVLGVQWHPEFGASDVSIRSLQNFNAEAQIYAKMHPKDINPEEILAITANSMEKEKWQIPYDLAQKDWSKAIEAVINKTQDKPKGRGR